MNKIAAFVAGDERIFFPALVALDSINNHNPDTFDFYMCFEGKNLTDEMREAIKYHNINFIDASKLGVTEKISTLELMHEGRWPVEIMYNWAIPEFLASAGYDHSIKVDYDILCIGKYELDELIPEGGIARGLLFDVDPSKEGVSPETLSQAIESGIYDDKKRSYINAGFVAFDNRKCVESKFFDKLIAAYQHIVSGSPKAKLIEQLAIAFALSASGETLPLDSKYNHRVRYGILVDDNLNPTAKNIHYITGIKPWLPFDRKRVRAFVDQSQGILFSYRAIWLERASASPWFSMFCDQKPMTHEQVLGLNIIVTYNYNKRIFELEEKIKQLS